MSTLASKPENLAQLVFLIRGEKVLLDADLASLYGVETGALNRAVKRNLDRFPGDFMFQLSSEDWQNLKCQIGISSESTAASNVKKSGPLRSQIVTAGMHGGRRGLPYAFTEQGVAMLSSVLHSPRAVEVNIAIMRTFVQLRRLMDSNRDLARKIEAMEMKYDEQFSAIFDAIKQLIADDQTGKAKPKRSIGFL
ncbi:MAG: ORF6N domain-containing protein [Sulfuritalea sp.]|nr:ORF6N domain-containing protein [Sulfuritalea sp.]